MFNHTVKFIELKVNTRESTIDNILVPDGISLSFFDRVSIKNLFIYLGFVIRNTVFATQVNKKKFSPGEHKDIIMGLAFIIAQWCSECQFFSKISSFFYGNPFDYLNYSQLKPRANLMYRILLLFTTKESYHPIVWRGRTILPFSIFHYSQSSSRRIYRSLKNFIQQEGTDDQKEQITIFENMRSCYVYDLYHKRVEVDSSQISMEKILAECGINLDTYTTEMLAAISGRMEKINDEIELTERLVLKMDGNIDITRHMISGLELSAEHVNMESNNDYKKDLSHLYRPLTSGDTTIFKGYLFAPFIWEYMAPNKELSVLVFGTGFGSILGGIVDKALNTTAGCITFYLHDFNPERSKGVSTLENVGDFLRQYPSDKVKIKITPESSITHSNLLIVDNYLKIINSFGQLYYDIIIWDCEGNLSTQASLFQKFLIAKPILDEVSEVVIYKFPTAISHSLSGIDIKYNNVLWHPGMSSVTLEVYILQSRDPPFRMILDEFDNNFMILREDPNYCWRMYAESISLIQLYSCVFFSGHNVLLLQFVSTCYFKGKDSLNYSHYRRLLLDFVLPKNSYEAKDFENCIPIYVCLMAFFLDSKAPLGDLYTRVTSDNQWFEEPYQSYISHMELARSYIQRGISLPNVKYIFRQIFRYHFATDSLKHTLIILRRVYNFLGYINMNKVSMKETLSLDLEQAGQYINDPLLRIKF